MKRMQIWAVIILAVAVLVIGLIPEKESKADLHCSEEMDISPAPVILCKRPYTNTSATAEEIEEALSLEKAKVAPVQQEEFEPFKAIKECPMDVIDQEFTEDICWKYHIGYAFFLAMMESESSFRAGAVGDDGRSYGYMQIRDVNWDRMMDEYELDVFDAFDNIECGAVIMSELIEKYGDIDMVIMAYKGGEAAAEKWKKEGFRLEACDTILERTAYWQKCIDER